MNSIQHPGFFPSINHGVSETEPVSETREIYRKKKPRMMDIVHKHSSLVIPLQSTFSYSPIAIYKYVNIQGALQVNKSGIFSCIDGNVQP
jgi:hypothetical protein